MSKPDSESPKPISAIVTGYEQLCRPGKLPDLVSFVAAAPALDPRDLAALVHIDQRHRHGAGAPLPAEEYFASFPILRANVELALDVVYQEYALKREAGEAYPNDKYLARFPDLAERLAMQFELDGALGDERFSPSLEDPQATREKPAPYAAETILAGRYQLLEEIGEGGMGTVWVAQQTEPVRRRVAVKLIKPGMDSRQVLSRFEAERQALALMDHPHIAKVLDGGATDQGRPFFVMEYVKGEPITEYCDRARLSVPERLKLFAQVCQAVQHAHQKGIIHRDLKPSNILVCPFDGHPVPKVIDFGLAKAMDKGLTEQSLYTAHGVMVGTPLYMSPEQAETNNLDIDTRSDVYSLGVILYELLTGSTPLEKQRFHEAAWQEMLRLIKEEEPPKPSTRLTGSGSLPTIAAQRNLEPAQLSRTVRGDLDWIVMKSLEKERSRRYETANGLARDIERYLHDDPVEARPPSAGYRFSKFARRNKAALLTAGLVAVALVVGTIVSTWQAIRATRAEGLAEQRFVTELAARHEADESRAAEVQQRRIAEDQRAKAEEQRRAAEANLQKAREAVMILHDVAHHSDVEKSHLGNMKAAELLVVGFPDVSEFRAHLEWTTCEWVWFRVLKGGAGDDYDVLKAFMDTSKAQLKERPNDRTARARVALASLTTGQCARWKRNDSTGAKELFQEARELFAELAREFPDQPMFPEHLGTCKRDLGDIAQHNRQFDEARTYYDSGASDFAKLVADSNVPQREGWYRHMEADVLLRLAQALGAGGNKQEALITARKALGIREALATEFPKSEEYRERLTVAKTVLAELAEPAEK